MNETKVLALLPADATLSIPIRDGASILELPSLVYGSVSGESIDHSIFDARNA